MYSTPTDNLTFRKGYNFNAKRFCCSPKQRTFKRDAYTATYDLDNKLQTFGNKTITYDNDGNMTSGPITEGGNNAALEFNARGQLMGTGDVAYAYDLENTRTIVMHYDKNKILTQYRYVYNRVGNVPEVLMRVKLTNMTSQSTYYVYGAGLAYEVKITPDGQEAVRYYHYDQVGSTVAMTDSAQAITDRFHYDPWGYVLHSIGDSDTPFQFVGAYGIQTDPNGLINMRARYYNPVTKSFISQDPSGFDGGLNWYLYANGNPFSYIDLSGKATMDAMARGKGWTPDYHTSTRTTLTEQEFTNELDTRFKGYFYQTSIGTYESYLSGFNNGVLSLNVNDDRDVGKMEVFSSITYKGNSKIPMSVVNNYYHSMDNYRNQKNLPTYKLIPRNPWSIGNSNPLTMGNCNSLTATSYSLHNLTASNWPLFTIGSSSLILSSYFSNVGRKDYNVTGTYSPYNLGIPSYSPTNSFPIINHTKSFK